MLNNVMIGNCIELMKDISDGQVHLTLTDIPYGVVNRSSNGLRVFNKKDADTETFDLEFFLKEIVRVTSGSIYVFCSTEQVSFIRAFLAEQKLATRLCILEKTNPSPVNGQYLWLSGVECCVFGKKAGATFNEFCKNTVWRYPSVRNKNHPTEKPLELFKYLIQVSSNEDDLVLDPCVGSGTTAVAAKMLKRNFIAFEVNGDYVEICRKRLNNA